MILIKFEIVDLSGDMLLSKKRLERFKGCFLKNNKQSVR